MGRDRERETEKDRDREDAVITTRSDLKAKGNARWKSQEGPILSCRGTLGTLVSWPAISLLARLIGWGRRNTAYLLVCKMTGTPERGPYLEPG